MKQKTIQSLSGADSGEITEVNPVRAKVQCDFRYRHLETLPSGGYRLWLGCIPASVDLVQENVPNERRPSSGIATPPYKRGSMQITCSPAPEKVIVGGARGERVIEGGSTSLTVELREGDEWIELKRQRYQPRRIPTPAWEHGDSLHEAVLLDPEI